MGRLDRPQAEAEASRRDLDEAWQIAERGPMRLFMADIHLHRARLFHAEKPYPWRRWSRAPASRVVNPWRNEPAEPSC